MATGPLELMRRHRAVLLAAVAVFVLAAALRLGHVESLRRGLEGTQVFSSGRVDAAFHLREAREILDHDLLLRDRVHWKGPGYSYFLAGMMTLLGPDPGSYRWALALLGALNCAALVLLARRFLDLPGAVIAGVLAAFNGAVLLFDAELYFPTLLISLNLGLLFALLRRDGGALAAAVGGLFLGLAVLVHPSYLLVGAAIFAWLLRDGARRVIAFALAAAAVVAPVTAKNFFVRGEPVLVSSSGGINFYIGNQPGYDQSSGQSTQAWDRVLQTPVDAGVSGEAERDRLYYRLAARQIGDAPGTALRLFAVKLGLFLGPLEIANNFRIYELRERSAILRVLLGRAGPLLWPFGLWAPLAAIGAVLLWRRRLRGQGLLLFWALGLTLTCVLFFNTARYRVPLVFFGSIWAAATLRAGWIGLRQRQWRRLALGSAAVLLLAALTAALAVQQTALPPPIENADALVLEQRGRHRDAARMHAIACAKNPGDPGLLLSAAAFHGRRGEQDRCRDYLRRVLEIPGLGPDDRSNALEALAGSLIVEGRLDLAEIALGDALAVGVDEAEWNGAPFFPLRLGPVTACRLELGLAEIAARKSDGERAARITADVVDRCGAHGRIAARMAMIEPWLGESSRQAPPEVR